MRRITTRGLLLLALLLAGALPALAQSTVRGRVTSAETQAPLSGVVVRVQGGTQGTMTNAQGQYMLPVPAGAQALVFTSLGYATQEVPIDGRAVIDVALQPSAVQLEQLVVVGYTTQARRDVSGAVAAVQAEELENETVATLEQALRGRVAGVAVRTSGEPGRAANIVVRGQNFLYGAGPLYVVDGLYMTQNPNLNPNDIESIQILKDASAAAQYGAQAANGVVVITTKRGRATDNNRLQLRSFYGMQEMPNRIEVMNARDWATTIRQGYENARAQNPQSDPVPAGILAVIEGTHSVDTDWQDAVLRRGAIQDHTLSMSGASEAGNASYFLSGGYTSQDGTILNTDFERLSLRVNSELRRGRLTLGENLSLARTDRSHLPLAEGMSPLQQAMRMPPAIPVRDPNNTPAYGYGSPFIPNFGTNPVGTLELRENTTATAQAFGTLYGEFELLEGLRYRLNGGFSYSDNENRFFQEAGGEPRQNNPRDPAFLEVGRDNYTSLLLENLLSYNREFGAHDVNAVAGYTEQQNERDFLWAYRRGFADQNLRQIQAGTENINNNGFEVDSRLRSYLARVNYSLADRYLATVSYRRDGSSRFGPGNRWGDFWSGSLGWVLSEEEFFRGVPLLNRAEFLKLRASYGTLGNQDFDDYQFAGLINQSGFIGYLFNGQVASGAIQTSLANPNIKWQQNTQQNYGVDVSLPGNAVSLTADYYISNSSDLLVRAPLPPTLGSQTSPFVNAGEVENRGFEFGLNHRFERAAFELNTNLNLTTIENEVISLGNNAQPIFAGGVARTAVGLPIGHFWVRDMIGIFQSEAEVQAHRSSSGQILQPNARPGDVKYADLNDDGVINDEDRYNAGDPVPDLEGGLFFDGRFGRIDFNFGFRGSYGNEIFNEVRYWMERMDDNSNLPAGLRPWTPQNPSNTTPRALIGGLAAANARRDSDRWVEDGSFVRFQNLQIGYLLPEGVFRTAGLQTQNARIYFNVQNLHTWTSYSGFDPDFVGYQSGVTSLERGIDFGRIYPSPRTFSIGIDLGL